MVSPSPGMRIWKSVWEATEMNREEDANVKFCCYTFILRLTQANGWGSKPSLPNRIEDDLLSISCSCTMGALFLRKQAAKEFLRRSFNFMYINAAFLSFL